MTTANTVVWNVGQTSTNTINWGIGSSPVPRMTIDSSGNFGIGSRDIGIVDHDLAEGKADVRPSNIVFNDGSSEMLRVAQDGFYVRGVKVPVDDKEALTVYEALKSWLVYANLTRNYHG